jgi:dTDP-4-dehydrorhamnose 3,5-epimerase
LIIKPAPLEGAFVIDLKRLEDDRGFFARSFCAKEFADAGLDPRVAQCNVSFNRRKGTIRGMHFQAAPHAEVKVVRCTQGSVWDVIVDLRHDSATFRHWYGVELTATNRRALYVPAGLAHGFQTLTDDCELLYMMSEFYVPDASRGFRWNDPAFAIDWPIPDPILSERDRNHPAFEE